MVINMGYLGVHRLYLLSVLAAGGLGGLWGIGLAVNAFSEQRIVPGIAYLLAGALALVLLFFSATSA